MVRKRGPCASSASGTASLCVELGEIDSHPPCPQASPPPWAAARGCVALPWGADAVRPPQTHILVVMFSGTLTPGLCKASLVTEGRPESTARAQV